MDYRVVVTPDAEDDFVLFRIVGDTVIIDNIFHNLQDYEKKIY